MGDEQFDDALMGLATIVSLWIGSSLLTEQHRVDGFLATLRELRDGYLQKGNRRAAAMVEHMAKTVEAPFQELERRGARRE